MTTTAQQQHAQATRRRLEPGRCVCGHKMHFLAGQHACWQHEVGTCNCREFQGVNGEPFSDAYYRGGKRYDNECASTASNQSG